MQIWCLAVSMLWCSLFVADLIVGMWELELHYRCRCRSNFRKIIDEGQITHLICARLKYDLYDFFRGVLGLLPVLFLVEKAQKHPLKKSYRSYFRRAQIR